MTKSVLYAQDEYVVGKDSNVNFINENCGRFVKISIKKTQRLTKRVKKLNDTYYEAFDRTQEKLLGQLCLINEGSAEYLRKDAQYSLNRFNNINARESAMKPKGKYSVLAQRNSDIERMVKMPKDSVQGKEPCACEELEALKRAQIDLNKELKRTEIIGGYIHEREQFLSKSLESVPDASKSLASMQKLEHYFTAQLKEHLNVFGLSGRWESQFLSILKEAIVPIPNMVDAGPEIKPPDWPNLKLEDLLIKAPEETKDAIAQLKSPIADLQNPGEVKRVQSELNSAKQKGDSLHVRLSNQHDSIQDNRSRADTLKLKKEKKQWKPNPLKTKRFVDRLIYSSALQVDRKTTWFPASGTITGSIGYQVHVKSTIGLGAHWTLAVDKKAERYVESEVHKRQLLSNGFGGRVYADVQLLKPIYFQGSYELSQRSYSYTIQRTELLPTRGLQASCLVGLKLKYPARKNHRPTFEILYDALHGQTGQPALIMRAGIELKPRNSHR